MAVGGGNPQQILRVHGKRISMLHLKDFRSFTTLGPDHQAIATEMGRGVLDNAGIVAAAQSAALHHVFVEQEGFDVESMDRCASMLPGCANILLRKHRGRSFHRHPARRR